MNLFFVSQEFYFIKDVCQLSTTQSFSKDKQQVDDSK